MEIVNKTVPREDAYLKVTGKAKYVDDYFLKDMLIAKVVRSRYAHAKILNIDTKKAEKLDGVHSIITANDIPGQNIIPLVKNDLPVLADGVTKHHSEGIALVAAETSELALTAVDMIDVEYEELPVLTDFLSSRTSIIKLHEDDNTFAHHKVRRGDISKAFQEVDYIIEEEYLTPYQEHAYLETQGMLAYPNDEGGIDVMGSMQCPFYVQSAVSMVLDLPLSKVRIIQTATGGAFGGKEDVPSLIASQSALLSFKTGRPVKLVLSREEDIASMSKRHPGYAKMKAGVMRDGTIKAYEVTYVLDGGAYATLSPVVLWRGTVHAIGPYKCDNVSVDAYAVATNKVPCGAYRGFGSPQILFAAERHIDKIARELNLSPVEIRKKNMLRKGDYTITGQHLTNSVGLEKTFDAVINKSEYAKKYDEYRIDESKTKKRGIGISTVYYGVALGAGGKYLARSGAFVQLLEDCSIQVAVGTTEMGQGMRTVLCQIASEQLGVPYENVKMLPVDTSRVPDSGPTVASRTTVMSGNAIIDACNKIRLSLFSSAADLLKCSSDKLYIKQGYIFNSDTEESISLDKTVKECFNRRLHLAAQGFFVSPHTSFSSDTGQGDTYITYSYATNVAEVEIDILTGELTVLKVVSAHDVGRAINPQLVEGQIEGGIVQGVGYAVMEDIQTENGRIINPNFSTYIIPTSCDAPEIVPLIVEEPFIEGPYGAKGFAEQPLMGMAPVIANAVANALGVNVTKIPLTAEYIKELIDNKL